MATITPANLAYKDKDGDLGEVKSLTDTDVTLLNNALQDIEDLKLAYMPGYVKRDFSNVTQDGKDAAISWGMPDYNSAIDITALVTSTNTSITIDKDSYIQCISKHNSANYTVQIYLDDILIIGRLSHSSGQAIYNVDNSFLIKAGVHTIRGNIEASPCTIKVIPCKGA